MNRSSSNSGPQLQLEKNKVNGADAHDDDIKEDRKTLTSFSRLEFVARVDAIKTTASSEE